MSNLKLELFRSPTKAKSPVSQLKRDAQGLFSGDRTGHIGYMRYGSPAFEGDKVLGAQFWYNSQQSDSYYLAREETELLKRVLSDDVLKQIVSKRFIDLGPGDIYAVANKSIPLVNELQIKDYIALDTCENYARDAAVCVATSCKVNASYRIANFFTRDLNIRTEKAFLFMGGSTISNIPVDIAIKDSTLHLVSFLRRVRKCVDVGSHFLIGYDANNDKETLDRSYNDNYPVSRFYQNAFWMIERDTDYVFDPDAFAYRGCWIPEEHRFAHYLVAQRDCKVTAANETYYFYKGAALHIDNSYKFPVAMMERAAENAGWKAKKIWTETGRVHYILFEAV